MSKIIKKLIRKAIVICVNIHKGGIGKTTTVFELARHMTALGKKVLVIDLDPQGNASKTIAGKKFREDEGIPTIGEALFLAKQGMANMIFQQQGLIRKCAAADLIPATITLEETSNTFRTDYLVLKKMLAAPVFQEYDYILLDTPPSPGILVTIAFAACDYVLVPVDAPNGYSDDALEKTMDTANEIKATCNPDMRLIGAFFNRVDRTSVSKGMMEVLSGRNPDLFLDSTISLRIAKANDAIFDTHTGVIPKNDFEKEFDALTREVIDVIEYTEAEMEENKDGE